ncbi:MAG TPA: hypothetical protein PL000_20180, partial [Anaerolineales bacterium]|nr:hypothetical protein [Anaerolineales bacterium]
ADTRATADYANMLSCEDWPGYLSDVLRRPSRRDDIDIEIRGHEGKIHPGAIRELVETYREVLKFLNSIRADIDLHPAFPELMHLIKRMEDPLRYISREMGLRLPRDPLSEKSEF